MAEDTTTPLDAVKATEKTSNYDDNGDHVVSQFVIGQEGFKPNASEDSKGVSIGYGTNNKNVKLGQTITEKEAYRLMQKDLKSTQGYVIKTQLLLVLCIARVMETSKNLKHY